MFLNLKLVHIVTSKETDTYTLFLTRPFLFVFKQRRLWCHFKLVFENYKLVYEVFSLLQFYEEMMLGKNPADCNELLSMPLVIFLMPEQDFDLKGCVVGKWKGGGGTHDFRKSILMVNNI